MKSFNESDKKNLWKQVSEKWDITPWSYWYPLRIEKLKTEVQENENILALDYQVFEKQFGVEKLNEIFTIIGISEFIKFSEEGDLEIVFEIDTNKSLRENLDFYWSTYDLNWIIYTTHEVSITFSGTWLVEQVKVKYATWKDALWS